MPRLAPRDLVSGRTGGVRWNDGLFEAARRSQPLAPLLRKLFSKIGINGLEAILLCLLAVMVLGPERLPEYASSLARIVRVARQLTVGAQEQLRGELGDDINDVDWRKLDPRQYDPRRIVREALLEDFSESTDTPATTMGNPPIHTTTSMKGFST